MSIQNLFNSTMINQALRQPRIDDQTFEEAWMPRIDEIKDGLGEFLNEQLSGFRAALYGAFQTLAAEWRRDIKEELLIRYLGFPFWDVLTFPIRYLSDVGELDEIEVMRMSPLDARKLNAPAGTAKLEGIGFGHFAAFFERRYRENDYLWGRLDAAEQIIGMLTEDNESPYYKQAFEAIIKEEEPALMKIDSLINSLKDQIGKL